MQISPKYGNFLSNILLEFCEAKPIELLELFALILLVIIDVAAEDGLLAADTVLELLGNAIGNRFFLRARCDGVGRHFVHTW